MIEESPLRYVGQPLRRREDLKFVTGKGRYVDDIKLPGMLHMAVLRSPHAHAKIKRIDLSAASGRRRAPCGSGADLAGKIGRWFPTGSYPGRRCRIVLSSPSIASVSSANAWRWWSRKRRDMAHDALGLIEVDYEMLPAVVDEEAAIEMARRNCTTTCPTTSPRLQDRRRRLREKPPARPIRSFACVSLTTV